MTAHYSEMFDGGNLSGRHHFDGAVLSTLKTTFDLVEEAHPQPDPSGEAIRLLQRIGRAVVCDRIVVHKNGRIGVRDLTKDTLTIELSVLRTMSELMQMALYQLEQTPAGLGGRRPGVVTPVRAR